jgi:hypothetical protein
MLLGYLVHASRCFSILLNWNVNFLYFLVILYLYNWHFVSFWNQTGVLRWRLRSMFVTVFFRSHLITNIYTTPAHVRMCVSGYVCHLSLPSVCEAHAFTQLCCPFMLRCFRRSSVYVVHEICDALRSISCDPEKVGLYISSLEYR